MSFYNGGVVYSKTTHEIKLDLSTENFCDVNNEQHLIDEAVLICSVNEQNNSGNSIEFFSNGNKITNVKK